MAKTTVAQWDIVAANNTDINSIPIDGAVTTPSQLDNIIREVMAQIKAGVALSDAGVITATTFLSSAGSAAAPPHSFAGDPDTGMYRLSADALGISTGGALILTINANGLAVAGPVTTNSGSAGTPSFSFTGDPDTGIYRAIANTLAFAAGGVNTMSMGSTGVAITGDLAVSGTLTVG